MHISPRVKSIGFFGVVLAVVAASFALAVRYYEADGRVTFSLTNQHGDTVTQKDLGGRYLLVFFGFTNCHGICPTHMSNLTRVMAQLDDTGHSRGVTPVFISVDPERDVPAKVAAYVERFDHRFVGLTGSRAALEGVAESFKTFLQDAPPRGADDYQVSHASTVYVIDPFGRIVDYLSFSEGVEVVAERVRDLV